MGRPRGGGGRGGRSAVPKQAAGGGRSAVPKQAAGGRGRYARAPTGADDQLIRGDLDEDEMRDELDEFELNRERKLLGPSGGAGAKARTRSNATGRSEVLAFDDDDSDSDAEYDQTTLGIAGEDVNEDDFDEEDAEKGLGDGSGIPSDKAWGKRKGSYYSADYVDEDWKGAAREETLELASMEEKEARVIQRRLAAEMEEADLELGVPAPAAQQSASDPTVQSETLPMDTARLSRHEKLKLLRQESPELMPLMDEFRTRWTELSTVVEPVYRLVVAGRVAAGPGADYVSCKRRLLLLYCLNISFYLQLRARRTPTSGHPVMRRIAQYGKLLHAAQDADQALEAELVRVSQLVADGVELRVVSAPAHGNDHGKPTRKGKRLRLGTHQPVEGTKTTSSSVDQKLAALTMEIDALEQEKQRVVKEKEQAGPSFTELRQAGQTRHNPLTPFRRRDRQQEPAQLGYQVDPSSAASEAVGEGEKRSITYQMAKNKGLMPKRSKESRNPRVKHKEKFKKALKKRRSIVRLPKKELQKYGGEAFGIRMGAVKSVPIK